MERTGWNYWRNNFLYGIIITAWFVSAVCGRWLNYAVFDFPEISIDDRTGKVLTSTAFRFPDKFEKTLGRYRQFRHIVQENKNIAIPGLVYTNLGDSYSNSMVPQGICLAEDYMLITAYDSRKEAKSVIYLLENSKRKQGSYLTTIVLPDRNHVGGITFDGENIWVAKSSSGYCSRISLDVIKAAASCGEDSVHLKAYEENVYCGVTASFVEYYNGQLWVGTHSSQVGSKGKLSCYDIQYDGERTELQLRGSMDIPPHAQGIAFLSRGKEVYMLLSASYGRYRDSRMYLYRMIEQEDEITLVEGAQYALPPMSEELVSDGEYTYMVFESAATCYSMENYRKCAYPVDCICAFSNEKLLPEK